MVNHIPSLKDWEMKIGISHIEDLLAQRDVIVEEMAPLKAKEMRLTQ